MPRPRIYASTADKHTQYRKRRAEERECAKTLAKQIDEVNNAHFEAASQEGNQMQNTMWYYVTIEVDRPAIKEPTFLVYIMSDEEIKLLSADLEAFAQSAVFAKYGTYAYADSGNQSHIPGTLSLAFEGLKIAEAKALPNYTPPNQYEISRGAVSILRTRH